MSCKHGVETLCATCINDAMCDAIREEGRLAGIREAIVVLDGCRLTGPHPIGPQAGAGWEGCRIEATKRLRALLPTPSGGEKAECTCTLTWTFYAGSDAGRAAWNACPVHAPKPAAEKP